MREGERERGEVGGSGVCCSLGEPLRQIQLVLLYTG